MGKGFPSFLICKVLPVAGAGRKCGAVLFLSMPRVKGLQKKDLDLLNGFGTGFGASDTESQVAHFTLYETLTTSAINEARAERDRKSKLYLMLGVFGGMAAAILLC